MAENAYPETADSGGQHRLIHVLEVGKLAMACERNQPPLGDGL